MTRRAKVIIAAASLVVSPFLLLTAYGAYWAREARGAVLSAAAAIAGGRALPGLEVETDEALRVAAALKAGYKVKGLDNIGLGFRAYEVKVRVDDGDQYNFDAYHKEDGWRVLCCNRIPAADLHD